MNTSVIYVGRKRTKLQETVSSASAELTTVELLLVKLKTKRNEFQGKASKRTDGIFSSHLQADQISLVMTINEY